MAVAALVLGIVAIVMCWFGPGGWIGSCCGILAIIFGLLGQKNDPSKKGMAKAGFVLGILSLIAGIIVTIACVACVGAAALADYGNYF